MHQNIIETLFFSLFFFVLVLFSAVWTLAVNVSVLNHAFCFIYGSLKRFKWLGEKNSVWNGMWCCTEVFHSHRLCSKARLDFTDSCPPPNHLLSLGLSFSPSLTSCLGPHLEISSIFHFLFIKSLFPLAILSVNKTLNHVENLLLLIIA